MNNVIAGYGEVGRGLGEVLALCKEHSVRYHDPFKDMYVSPMLCDILHICIPGNSTTFISDVTKLIGEFKPKLTIIHSTILPGTTRKIGGEVIHSPVRGKHPDMASHIRVYTKHFGILQPGSWYSSTDLIRACFEPCGINCYYHETPEETELGKILELFRYGMDIYVASTQKMICDYYDSDYKGTVKRFIETYNEGLETVGYPQYKQANCEPMLGNKLGGHCVIENCFELWKNLADQIPTELLYKLIRFGQGDRDLL